jgi:hypothetical protein
MTAQPLKQARAPEADAAPKRELAPAQVTVRAAATEPAPAPVPQPTAEPEQLERPEFDFPRTVRDTLRHVDQAWHAFRVVANRFPNERMDERLGEEGWTRKQMLAHVAAWHDLTADRLVKFITTGEPPALAMETDAFNASVARRAIGKTAGEILKDIEATFNRVRRQMARLSDAQLASHDWWAAFVIGGNTYGHYQEHWTDIWTPEPTPGGRR